MSELLTCFSLQADASDVTAPLIVVDMEDDAFHESITDWPLFAQARKTVVHAEIKQNHQ